MGSRARRAISASMPAPRTRSSWPSPRAVHQSRGALRPGPRAHPPDRRQGRLHDDHDRQLDGRHLRMTGDGTGDADRRQHQRQEFDRHRRRVLWALPTGLYLVGSRHGDEANLMTANLVVQVCLEPKLVGVALERDSMTARLVAASGAFTISLLPRGDRDVVRRFVKPVTDINRAADGVIVAMAGHPVREVGPQRLPVLSAAAGHLACTVTRRRATGKPHLLHRRGDRGGRGAGRGPADGGHPHALRRLAYALPVLSASDRCGA